MNLSLCCLNFDHLIPTTVVVSKNSTLARNIFEAVPKQEEFTTPCLGVAFAQVKNGGRWFLTKTQ